MNLALNVANKLFKACSTRLPTTFSLFVFGCAETANIFSLCLANTELSTVLSTHNHPCSIIVHSENTLITHFRSLHLAQKKNFKF